MKYSLNTRIIHLNYLKIQLKISKQLLFVEIFGEKMCNNKQKAIKMLFKILTKPLLN